MPLPHCPPSRSVTLIQGSATTSQSRHPWLAYLVVLRPPLPMYLTFWLLLVVEMAVFVASLFLPPHTVGMLRNDEATARSYARAGGPRHVDAEPDVHAAFA